MGANVSSEEVADLLHKIAAGEITLRVVGETWDECYAGDVTFELSSGDKLVIFNDCDDFDYVDSVRLVDGREGDFDDWAYSFDKMNEGHQPDWLLTNEERARCFVAFKAAPRKAGSDA